MIAGLVKPTLAIDFDGVLNTYASGYRADYIPDPPVRGALEALKSYAEVFQIVLFTTRASEPEGVAAIVDWMNRNGFAQIPLTITAEKPAAQTYLDDRSWQFMGPGTFPSATDLLEFKPWWGDQLAQAFPEIDASTSARAVASLAARAGAAEPVITDAVARAVKFAGGELGGVADRLKARSALAGKLAAVMAEKSYTLEQAAADIKDSLRFTAVFDAERYAAAAAGVLALLERGAGLELTRLRNYWLPEQGGSRYAEGTYAGINAVLAAPNGFQFELQFHTPQSVAVQAINWDLYRLIRSGNLAASERERIEAQMRENNAFVAEPPKVAALAPVVAAGAMIADGQAQHYRETANHAVTLPLVSAAPGVTSLSTMIAVKPRPDEAEAIAAPGGDPPENLHITLAYLGEVEGELEPIVDALRIVAAEHAPLEGVVGGFGAFDPPGVGILLPDVRGLVELRTAVCEALIAAEIDYSRDHGFEAHITVVDPDYERPNGAEDYPGSAAGAPLHFDEIIVVRGDSEIVAIPFTGTLPVTASALTAAAEPFCLPAELRGKSDPIRQAFVKAVMTPALEQAGLSWDITNPLAADVISRVGQHVVGISQTTQDDLMNVVNTAHEQGLSIPDTAKAIRAHMAEASHVRATMIARTELAAAVNGGSLAATKIAAEVTGATATKSWMTAPGATYPRHEDYEGLDGQTVHLDEDFDVGGSPLQYPGDPDGDPGEVINCRCTLEYSGAKSDTTADNIDAAGAPHFSLAHHNRILQAAYKRVDELEPKLAAVLQPILERAGEIAAQRFELLATNHLTAANDPANPAGWTPPAPEEMLPVNCEANPDALGLTSENVDAGTVALPAPTAGGPGGSGSVVRFTATTDYNGFIGALEQNARPGFLTVHSPEELARNRIFLTADGKAGFSVTPEGDLQNVFRNPGGVKGAGRQAVRQAVQQEGAKTLDAYDGFLPDLYQREGFGIVGRMKWVDEYAPDGWDYKAYGRPDVVFMAVNPDPAFEVKTFADWDEAKAYSVAAARAPIPTEILDTAETMVSHAAELAPSTTAELSSIADAAGGKMAGLDFAVKSQPSLVRKIANDLADARMADPTATVQEVAGTINDALRYTMTFPESGYSSGVETALQRLEKAGYQQIKLKNYWGNADYQGINAIFEKDGQRLELQFHTPRTFELKTELHAQYEQFRVSTDPAERLRLWNEMATEQAKNKVPPGAFSLGERVTHEAPSGAQITHVQMVQEIIPGVPKSTLTTVNEEINRRSIPYSQKHNMTPDEYQAAALDSIRRGVENAQVRIRIDAAKFSDVLDDGRFKTQFETGKSKGLLNQDIRAKAERFMFGYSKTLAPEERPIYGYLAGSANETGGISGYGDLIVVLKADANARTTFSLGDSLGQGAAGGMAPSPLLDPALGSWGIGVDPVEANGVLGQLTPGPGQYVEAQIHGGVTTSDIAEVIFSAAKEKDAVEGSTAMANIMRDRLTDAEKSLAYKQGAGFSPEELAKAEDEVQRAREQAAQWLAISEQTMMQGSELRARLDELGVPWKILDDFEQLGGGNPEYATD